jgi:hypothetical protein
MKKFITIVLLLLLFLQAIPVVSFFASPDDNFYSYVDEDKPGELKIKDKKECKEYVSPGLFLWSQEVAIGSFEKPDISSPASPYLQYLTPPPDCTC